MKTTIKNILLAFIAMTALYSCSSNDGDNPEPKPETDVRKKMSAVITVTGNLDTHTMNIIVMAISKIGDSSTLPMSSPVIDDRDKNSYSQIVYQKGDFENSKTVSAHSQKEVVGMLVILTISPFEQDVKGDIKINIKIYADKKLLEERNYENTSDTYQKSFQVLADTE